MLRFRAAEFVQTRFRTNSDKWTNSPPVLSGGDVLGGFCHLSEFGPRRRGKIQSPAPQRLTLDFGNLSICPAGRVNTVFEVLAGPDSRLELRKNPRHFGAARTGCTRRGFRWMVKSFSRSATGGIIAGFSKTRQTRAGRDRGVLVRRAGLPGTPPPYGFLRPRARGESPAVCGRSTEVSPEEHAIANFGRACRTLKRAVSRGDCPADSARPYPPAETRGGSHRPQHPVFAR